MEVQEEQERNDGLSEDTILKQDNEKPDLNMVSQLQAENRLLRDEVASLAAQMKNMNEQINKLTELFNDRIRYTEFEETSRKNMNDELQSYKKGLLFNMIRPFIVDMIQLREDILNDCQDANSNDQAFISQNQVIAYAEEDIFDMLDKMGVEMYRSNKGDEFVSGRQRAKKIMEKTHDKELHGKVAESLSYGYSYEGKIVYPEWVKRYIYEEE